MNHTIFLTFCFCVVLLCTGLIPKELGGLTNLRELWLGHNQLSGKSGKYSRLLQFQTHFPETAASRTRAKIPGFQNPYSPPAWVRRCSRSRGLFFPAFSDRLVLSPTCRPHTAGAGKPFSTGNTPPLEKSARR